MKPSAAADVTAPMLILLVACAEPAPPPPLGNLSDISVTYCDKAEHTRLVRVGIGGENNIGETAETGQTCADNGKPMGCAFAGVEPGTYRVEDGLWSAMVYAGPLPSPAGDAHVELACQRSCVSMVSVTTEGCGAEGTMHVYTSDPAPIASSLGTYPWVTGTPVKIGPTTCGRLVAEVETADCGTLVAGIQPSALKSEVAITLGVPQRVDLSVTSADGKALPGAYVADDTFRTQHADAEGRLALLRQKGAPGTIWVQAAGFAGGLFEVPRAPVGDGAAPPVAQPIAMVVALKPTHPLTVTCEQAGKPCAGPVVMVGQGVATRGCQAETPSTWTCEAAADDTAWARQGTTVSPRVPVTDKDAVTVQMPG